MTLGRSALGKGLSALIPAPRYANQRDDYFLCSIADVAADPGQPRMRFDDERLDELVASIKEKGILQPLVVRKALGEQKGYIVIAGERRLRAARKAGLSEVPVLVKDVATNEALELALIENLQREDLNPVEEAEAYRALIDQFGYTQEELSRRVGKDRSTVSNTLRLLKLPPEVLDALVRGAVTMGHGRALLGLDDHDRIREVFTRVVADGLTVRQTEEAVRQVREGLTRKARAKVGPLVDTLVDLQDRLARHLGTRVKLRPRARGEGGKIVLEYYTQQDLDRLVERIEGELF